MSNMQIVTVSSSEGESERRRRIWSLRIAQVLTFVSALVYTSGITGIYPYLKEVSFDFWLYFAFPGVLEILTFSKLFFNYVHFRKLRRQQMVKFVSLTMKGNRKINDVIDGYDITVF